MRITLLLTTLALGVATQIGAAQSTRLGWPADPQATSDEILIVRQYDRASGQGYGTLPAADAAQVVRALASQADVAIIEMAGTSPSVHAGSATRPLTSSEITFNALSLLRIQPALGRDFTEADARAGARVAILTAGAWRSGFNSQPEAIGSKGWRLRNGVREDVLIIGVLAPGALTSTPELDIDSEVLVLADSSFDAPPKDERWFAPILRLRPGVTAAQAQAAIDREFPAARTVSIGGPSFGIRLESLRRMRR